MTEQTDNKITDILEKYLKVIAPKDNTCIESKFGNHINFNYYEKQKVVKDILVNEKDNTKSILKIFNSRQDEKVLSGLMQGKGIEKEDSYIHSISNKNRLSVFIQGLNDKNVTDKIVDDKLKDFHGKLINKINSLDKIINEKLSELDNKDKSDNVLQGLHVFFNEIYGKDNLLNIDGLNNRIPRAIYEILYCYRLHQNNLSDQIPLINGCALDVCEWIMSNEPDFVTQKSKIEKYKEIINKLINKIPKIAYNNINEISKYFILDQFFNLIHKVKPEDINDIKNNDIKELYGITQEYKKKYVTKGYYKDMLKDFNNHLKHHKNIIFYGSPGTGKTYISELCCKLLASGKKINTDFDPEEILKKTFDNVKLVQFHPSYTYEDFIEGIRPEINNGQMVFKYKKGHFREFVDQVVEKNKKAKEENRKNDKKYFFIIDEINRANLSAVFGEILYALEKRGQTIITQYSHSHLNDNKIFKIPENVYVIGTMNDIDRSIDAFDLALRRRFMWVRLDFDENVLRTLLISGSFPIDYIDGYIENCKALNKYLNKDLGLGKSFELGHAYYKNIVDFIDNSKQKDTFKDDELNMYKTKLFVHHLSPLIKEYLRSKYDELEINGKIEECKNRFI